MARKSVYFVDTGKGRKYFASFKEAIEYRNTKQPGTRIYYNPPYGAPIPAN